MAGLEKVATDGSPGGARFATTHWSLVLAAAGTDAEGARQALGRLLEGYWYPLYAFVRRKGHGPEEASDLTQEFLSQVLARRFVDRADPEKGRFRSFLLAALKDFLVDEHRREARQKRGGDRSFISLSTGDAEERYRLEPADTVTPERIYERRWALTLLEAALERLGDECAAAQKEALFAAARPILSGDDASSPYAELAARLGMKEGALKTAVHRLRRRYAAILRDSIAQTVARPGDVDDEIRHFFTCLR